ncbi:DUF1801 domain-containing protein [Capnocytophaga sp. ARDL2]|uniref:DUF1801 domain-containing protein n=1 Tax=Capnocytophaga sp. ARDL2 TaxID=3238809 RepID=UPI003557E38D
MKIEVTIIKGYIAQLPKGRQVSIEKLRSILKNNLLNDFVEQLSDGMIGYVVPHSIYPKKYHCTPELPLPLINIAFQKNFIALYHMGVYADSKLLEWFTNEYPKHCKTKLNMRKSCIRFKKNEKYPLPPHHRTI